MILQDAGAPGDISMIAGKRKKVNEEMAESKIGVDFSC
jgi:hypothetical protein